MKLGLVTEAFADQGLWELLDWLAVDAPNVRALEVGSGGYAPPTHCNAAALLADVAERQQYLSELGRRDFTICALNVWGNPLHPDAAVSRRHDADLRVAIRLAALLGVDRIVALAGCPAAVAGDRAPYFAGGGWLPYLEEIYDTQWERVAGPYWSEMSEFAHAEHPDLLVCVELHPGTCVYNVETFARLAGLGSNLAANVDPSHFFWQRMDSFAVVAALPRIGHAHAKDLVFNRSVLAVQGLLDHRWSGVHDSASWRFAQVGHGHDTDWWLRFCAALAARGVETIALEHEDPTVAPDVGVVEAARLLSAHTGR